MSEEDMLWSQQHGSCFREEEESRKGSDFPKSVFMEQNIRRVNTAERELAFENAAGFI